MYNVSEAYKTQLHARARFEHVRGVIGNTTYNDSNIIAMSYSNRCSDTSDITLGSAYIGQLEAQLINVNINRGDWRGLIITVEAGLQLADNTVEYIPLGIFTIASAEWTERGVRIVANDNVIKLDKPLLSNAVSGGSIYHLMLYACSDCGVNFGMTEEEVEALPNGTEVLSLYSENDVKTYRDFVSWIAQAVGGFVTADREGNIILRSFNGAASEVDTLTASDRINGSVFSDYTTLYDGISIVNIEDKSLQNYVAAGATGNGGMIALGSNPFLQYGLDETKTRQRETLAAVAASLEFTPFTTSILSTIAYDLGDVIKCTGGIAGNTAIYCLINSIEWAIKQTTLLQGFGADPALATAQSKTDKNLTGLLSKVSSQDITYYYYTNIDDIELPESTEEEPHEITVVNLLFAAKEQTQVDLWHEIKLDLTLHDPEDIPVYNTDDPPEQIGTVTGVPEPAEVIMRYYYDDNLVGYSPVNTYGENGYHIFNTNYFIDNVTNNQSHKWRVTLEVKNGSAAAVMNNVKTLLRGQSLVGEPETDNIIHVEDLLGRYDVAPVTAKSITEEVAVTIATILAITGDELTDSIARPDIIPVSVRAFTDAVTITLKLVNWVWMSGQAYSGDYLDDTLF